MASLMRIVNRLLPFATPGTPLLQDLVHLGVICALLYFAPQIQERLQKQLPEQRHEGEQPQVIQDDPIPDAGVQPEADDVDDQHDADNIIDNEEAPRVPNEGEAGPAHAPMMPPQRNVGAKKAKSLARRDQKRAYNEFMRTQGEAQRAKDAEGAAEREAEQEAERERRKAAAATVEAKKAKEREQRREQERKAREGEISRRDTVLSIARRELEEMRMVNLFDVASRVGGDADEIWVERILNAGGILGWSNDGSALTTVTSTGWVIRVSRDDMMQVYDRASNQGDATGRIKPHQIGSLLEAVLREQAV
ncbi:uncharacterized protein MYCGRDRAFT_107972 [Zymoseptoria tritici IPO323]|uniref:Uncharacterized protein n=1 Tax=Zymoseptoria tritici (strain CBS 115943 / IPO323) TaxID=336722 RepID=F9X3K7_ZYMTI|nr:uncharacterized protein MYCGRDRAFT_107972 [Zymoseptoria tritici IPO323]EGP90618.1 hypothetical protein MYCGRDRAFT_107972 [Zymoseptoria tritici IPO323]